MRGISGQKFRDETPENPKFLKNGRTVKFGQNLDFFSRSRMTKRTSPLESSGEI